MCEIVALNGPLSCSAWNAGSKLMYFFITINFLVPQSLQELKRFFREIFSFKKLNFFNPTHHTNQVLINFAIDFKIVIVIGFHKFVRRSSLFPNISVVKTELGLITLIMIYMKNE